MSAYPEVMMTHEQVIEAITPDYEAMDELGIFKYAIREVIEYQKHLDLQLYVQPNTGMTCWLLRDVVTGCTLYLPLAELPRLKAKMEDVFKKMLALKIETALKELIAFRDHLGLSNPINIVTSGIES